MKNILVLPLDDRPVNYDYPRTLARIAGVKLLLPERAWLGNPWRASQHDKLVEWLAQNAPHADAVILALDTLAYGGLIPSRTSAEPVESVLRRLEFLRDLKRAAPALPIYASSVILRVSRDNSSEEEKPYWASFGARMFRLSYLEHKASLGEASADEQREQTALRQQIPDPVYTDYLAGRTRNHAINRAMIDWAEQGVFDYLVLPQDDTAEYGWNIAEARSLQAAIRRKGLTERAITYPGADEIGSLLLAACLCRGAGYQPRVWARYSSTLSPAVITPYEDRPFHEMIKAHLAPLDGWMVDAPADANLQLFVNAPVLSRGDGHFEWAAREGVEEICARLPAAYQAQAREHYNQPGLGITRAEMQSPWRSPEEFTRALLAALRSGQNVALADVVYSNGMDIILGGMLARHAEIARLASVGGWNTAGNTLGTVLAQAAIHGLAQQQGSLTPDQTAAQLEFLFMRWIDDYYYQGIERSRILMEDYPALGLALDGGHIEDAAVEAQVEACVQARLQRCAAELREVFVRSGLLRDVQISQIYLPWQRLFEVGFEVQVRV